MNIKKKALDYDESQVPIPMDEIDADEYAERNSHTGLLTDEYNLLRQGYLGACKPKNDEIHAFGIYITENKLTITETNVEEIHEKFQLQYNKD